MSIGGKTLRNIVAGVTAALLLLAAEPGAMAMPAPQPMHAQQTATADTDSPCHCPAPDTSDHAPCKSMVCLGMLTCHGMIAMPAVPLVSFARMAYPPIASRPSIDEGITHRPDDPPPIT